MCEKCDEKHLATSSQIDVARIERAVLEILEAIGEDPARPGLLDTPKRVAKWWREFIGYNPGSVGTTFEDASAGVVMVSGMRVWSMCEHHLLPFIGKVHVAYIPSGKVLGLSKVARIADMYARRLQIQENLTKQIADAIQEVTDARGVAVTIEAKHMCMMMRGVEKQNSVMKTSIMLGLFRENPQTRNEFLALINS